MKMTLPPYPDRPADLRRLDRRTFLSTAAKGLGAAVLLSQLPRGFAAADLASDAPESPDVNFGMIALTDCSPIVIAHEKGLFKKYGINSKVTKGANWAAIRDSLSSGSIQATHMLIGMPFASTMGLLGSPKKPMIIPWLLNRNGQAITLKSEWKGKVEADPKALKPYVEQAKKLGEPLTFAMTFPTGTHAMWMRYYLAAGGIHPGGANGEGADITLITVPPAQMVANMKIGKMDGFCVGEPWGARSIADSIGFTSVTTQDIWKDHPEKVCAFTEEFAAKNPKTVKAVLKALHEASVWLDDMGNRPEQCQIVSKATYINCDPKTILGRLLGDLDYGDGRKVKDGHPMYFSKNGCNYPQPKYGLWFMSQYRRWGMVAGTPDYDGVVKKVMRGDIYAEAMKEIGVAVPEPDMTPETLFDGVAFNPQEPEAYAKGFSAGVLRPNHLCAWFGQMKRFPPFSAVVLAGGHSSRMGRDKALLPLADARTLLARQLAILLSAGASELLVSARAEQKLPLEGARLVLDTHSGQGPLAGIAAALATAVHPQVLVLAIDLGQMPAEFLAGLVAASRPGHGLIPLRSGEPEPLAAVYPGNFGPFAVQALAAGERRASDWARQLVNQGLSEWRDVTPMEAGYFANWNTPADLGPKLGPTA